MEIFITCLIIFLARVVDVGLGTFRMVCIVKDKKLTATIIAFIEIFIWFMVAKEAISTNLKSLWVPISYSAGFATGTYLGLLLSGHIISSQYTINAISSKITHEVIDSIKKQGYGVSLLSMEGRKKMIILQVDKKRLVDARNMLKRFDEDVFIMINETKHVHNGFIK